VATALALDRERLLRIKEKLHRNRLQMPLFDTPVFTHGLEAAYEAMYQRLKMGLPPDHIEVKPERSIGHL
jgi:predicted O-linked N-acetylglucosamine transferase (SPINDLY family)